MYQNGHYGAALVAYAPVVFGLTALAVVTLSILGRAVVDGGAMLPDIDQRILGVKHRGPTHTIWFALAGGGFVGLAGAALAWPRGPVATLIIGLLGLGAGTLFGCGSSPNGNIASSTSGSAS